MKKIIILLAGLMAFSSAFAADPVAIRDELASLIVGTGTSKPVGAKPYFSARYRVNKYDECTIDLFSHFSYDDQLKQTRAMISFWEFKGMSKSQLSLVNVPEGSDLTAKSELILTAPEGRVFVTPAFDTSGMLSDLTDPDSWQYIQDLKTKTISVMVKSEKHGQMMLDYARQLIDACN